MRIQNGGERYDRHYREGERDGCVLLSMTGKDKYGDFEMTVEPTKGSSEGGKRKWGMSIRCDGIARRFPRRSDKSYMGCHRQ